MSDSLAYFRFPERDKVELCINVNGSLTVVELSRKQFWNMLSDGLRHAANNYLIKGGTA